MRSEAKIVDYVERASNFNLNDALDHRSRLREKLLNVYFESYYILTVKLQRAQMEIWEAQETLSERKKDPNSSKFWGIVAHELHDDSMLIAAGPLSLVTEAGPLGMLLAGQESLEQIVMEDNVEIKVYQDGLNFIRNRIDHFYGNEKNLITSLLNRQSGVRDASVEKPIIEDEIGNIEMLKRNTEELTAGFDSTPSDIIKKSPHYKTNPNGYFEKRQNDSIRELSRFNFRGYEEFRIVQTWIDSAQAAAKAKGNTYNLPNLSVQH